LISHPAFSGWQVMAKKLFLDLLPNSFDLPLVVPLHIPLTPPVHYKDAIRYGYRQNMGCCIFSYAIYQN